MGDASILGEFFEEVNHVVTIDPAGVAALWLTRAPVIFVIYFIGNTVILKKKFNGRLIGIPGVSEEGRAFFGLDEALFVVFTQDVQFFFGRFNESGQGCKGILLLPKTDIHRTPFGIAFPDDIDDIALFDIIAISALLIKFSSIVFDSPGEHR